MPSAGLTLFGKPMHDRERGADRPAGQRSAVHAGAQPGLEWSSAWIAVLPAATLGLSLERRRERLGRRWAYRRRCSSDARRRRRQQRRQPAARRSAGSPARRRPGAQRKPPRSGSSPVAVRRREPSPGPAPARHASGGQNVGGGLGRADLASRPPGPTRCPSRSGWWRSPPPGAAWCCAPLSTRAGLAAKRHHRHRLGCGVDGDGEGVLVGRPSTVLRATSCSRVAGGAHLLRALHVHRCPVERTSSAPKVLQVSVTFSPGATV